MIDAVASAPHYREHLQPIWAALPDGLRGRFRSGPVRAPLTLVASWGDLRRLRGRPCVYVEHGVGMSYSTDHPSYAGGRPRPGVRLFLCPNEYVAARNRAAHPEIPSVVVGSVKVPDDPPALPAGAPVVAVSFHWDCQVAPEAGSALRWYRRHALRSLVESPAWTVIGAGHPRARPALAPVWRQLGVEAVHDWAVIERRAHLYVVDTSSTLYEFAALDRPVVALNAPTYRRDVHHGLRFWDHVPGPQVDEPGSLVATVEEAFEDPPAWREARAAAVAAAYPHRGATAARLAAAAVVEAYYELLANPPPPQPRGRHDPFRSRSQRRGPGPA